MIGLLFAWLTVGPALAQRVEIVSGADDSSESDAQPVLDEGLVLEATPLPGVTVGGIRVTVAETTRPCPDPWRKPPPEHEWVCYLVTLYNVADDLRSYGPEQITLLSWDGGQVTPIIEGSLGDGLQSGMLAPGGAVAGVLRFELPERTETRALRFDPALDDESEGSEIPL